MLLRLHIHGHQVLIGASVEVSTLAQRHLLILHLLGRYLLKPSHIRLALLPCKDLGIWWLSSWRSASWWHTPLPLRFRWALRLRQTPKCIEQHIARRGLVSPIWSLAGRGQRAHTAHLASHLGPQTFPPLGRCTHWTRSRGGLAEAGLDVLLLLAGALHGLLTVQGARSRLAHALAIAGPRQSSSRILLGLRELSLRISPRSRRGGNRDGQPVIMDKITPGTIWVLCGRSFLLLVLGRDICDDTRSYLADIGVPAQHVGSLLPANRSN